jgi:hypothetical protein
MQPGELPLRRVGHDVGALDRRLLEAPQLVDHRLHLRLGDLLLRLLLRAGSPLVLRQEPYVQLLHQCPAPLLRRDHDQVGVVAVQLLGLFSEAWVLPTMAGSLTPSGVHWASLHIHAAVHCQ